MTQSLAIALAQVNPTVGDIDGNVERLRAARAAAGGADLVVAGELVVSGYPPEDLVLKSAFQDAVEAGVEALAGDTADGGPAMLVGAPWRIKGGRIDGRLYNAALLLDGGAVAAVTLKHDLPNYGVFDEKRVFAAGPLPTPLSFRDNRLGVMVCEDMWTPDVAGHLRDLGAALLIVINGSPFDAEKTEERAVHAARRVGETGLSLVYVNLVGGQDELVFDGGSFVLGPDAQTRLRAPAWTAGVTPTRWQNGAKTNETWTCEEGPAAPPAEGLEAIWRALTVGLCDYVDKNGFPGVLIGLSGGIDSALSAAVAVDALGAGRVHAVMMPSPYTSPESLEDAAEAARLLGIRLDTHSIEPAMEAFEGILREAFASHPPDTTEENIQARARGITLMALSNKFGHMVLSTGNKSEMSVGYATLYGDMCGGYSVLKDIYKTTVYALAGWRNTHMPPSFQGPGAQGPDGRVIPERILTKAPSAELRPGQTDQDSLPPYATLDAILHGLIEDEMSVEAIVAQGHDADTVQRVWTMLDRAEYKRRQAPPGVKITGRAFGRDRRYPITNRFTPRP